MPDNLLVEETPHQTRVALLQDGRLAEVFVEDAGGCGERVGDVYRARVSRVVPGLQAAFVDLGGERNAFLYLGDAEAEPEDAHPPRASLDGGPLRAGQRLLVQVTKEPLGGKGARVATDLALPGRYLVLLPGASGVGVSRRIEDAEERERLRAAVEGAGAVPGGVIVRTAAAGRHADELAAELERLTALWRAIETRAGESTAPALVHRDLELPQRVARDVLGAEIDSVWVDREPTLSRLRRLLSEWDGDLGDRVRLHQGTPPLFARFDVERQIESALRRRVWLRSGGYLVIHSTEALVAVDVNTGRYVGTSDLEQTALRINLEAAEEVAHQIRLRDLAGIIVVDFIDMLQPENRARLRETLISALARDRARTQVSEVSEVGLVEITRKRSRTDLLRRLTRPCPYCRGQGRIRTATAVATEIRRHLLGDAERLRGRTITLRVHPEIGDSLADAGAPLLQELEAELGSTIRLERDPGLHHEGFRIV